MIVWFAVSLVLTLLFMKAFCFATDLIDDWSSKARPDIFHFVPYTWHLNFIMKEFELITLTNEYNWIDCFGQTPENGTIESLVKYFSTSSVLYRMRCFE